MTLALCKKQSSSLQFFCSFRMFGDYIIRSSQLRRAMIGILCLVSQAAEQSMEGQLKERIHRIAQIFPDAALLEKLLFHFVNMMAEDEKMFSGVKRLVADNYTSSEINSASVSIERSPL